MSSSKKIILLCVGLILLAVIVFSGLHILESTVFHNEQEKQYSESKTVEVDGIKYFPKQDITTILFMGIDDDGPVVRSEGKTNDSFVDVLALVVFDETEQDINVIYINRDTMVEMTSIDENGKRDGIYYGQISFSHTFGSGMEDSCENTARTVSDLLNGVQIDYYVSLNMGAVPILNDAVGGVTVDIKDDFSEIDPSLTFGEHTLMGNQALTFIRARKNLGDSLNVSRMERQKEYAYAFADAFKSTFEVNGQTFLFKLLDKINEYMVTNCPGETLAAIAERYQDYEMGEIVSPKGKNVQGKMYYEFYVDEEDLNNIVLKYLYAPK